MFLNPMRNYRIVGILSVVSLLCFSCVTPKKTHYLQDPDKGIAAYPQVYTPADYKVQVSDELDIDVYTLDEASQKILTKKI